MHSGYVLLYTADEAHNIQIDLIASSDRILPIFTNKLSDRLGASDISIELTQNTFGNNRALSKVGSLHEIRIDSLYNLLNLSIVLWCNTLTMLRKVNCN